MAAIPGTFWYCNCGFMCNDSKTMTTHVVNQSAYSPVAWLLSGHAGIFSTSTPIVHPAPFDPPSVWRLQLSTNRVGVNVMSLAGIIVDQYGNVKASIQSGIITNTITTQYSAPAPNSVTLTSSQTSTTTLTSASFVAPLNVQSGNQLTVTITVNSSTTINQTVTVTS